jgi:fucose 4-O-acetylase-like acetyltransferase
MSKRIEFLDAAKGIGILFVVLGHNPIKTDYPIVYQVVYSFHMPFFFLLSGMFFKTDYGWLELARRRFNSLLKPFIAYMLIVYSGAIFFTKIDLPTIFLRIAKALYAGPSTLEWIPLWFLPHLFLVNLLAFILIKFVYDRLPLLWMRLLFLAAMLWVGVATIRIFLSVKFSVLGHDFEFYGLPWSADLLLVTTAFFILGYEIRRTFTPLISPHCARASAAGTGEPQNGGNEGGRFPYLGWVLIIAIALFAGLHIVFQSTIDFYIRSYGPVVVSSLEAVSGSLLILYLAKWLEKGPTWLFGALKYLGTASIVVLIFHYVPQEFLYQKLIAFNMNTLLASMLAFCAGVVFPLLLFAWVIYPNRLLSSWFGIGQPQEQERTN